MPRPASADDLLSLVRQSGLLADQQLLPYHPAESASGVGDPHDLAARLVRDRLLTDFQAQRLLEGRWRGFFLGEYRILRPLGKGGMGQVYLARQEQLGRHVALKVLSNEGARTPGAAARFRREAQALAALDHPNIVRAYDLDEKGGLMFLVLEYVDGASLLQVVESFGPLEVARAANTICQAALGLDHAHQAGWAHRDVKPGNLLIDRQGQVKVLDLGLARLCEGPDEERLTRATAVLGTADYLAPEQALDSHDADRRADVYSLGATFYHLLAGQPPFPGGTTLEKIQRHRLSQPHPIKLRRPAVPAGLAAVIERMMAKKPQYRYQTAAEVVEALAPWSVVHCPVPVAWFARGTGCEEPTAEAPAAPPPTAAQAEGAPVAVGAAPEAETMLIWVCVVMGLATALAGTVWVWWIGG